MNQVATKLQPAQMDAVADGITGEMRQILAEYEANAGHAGIIAQDMLK